MRKLAFILVPLLVLACNREPAAPDAGVGPQFGATATNEVVYTLVYRVTWMDSQDDWDVLLLGFEPSDDPACNGGVEGTGIAVREHYVVSMQGVPDEFSQRDQTVVTTIGRPPLYMYLRSDFPDNATDEEWCTFLKNGWAASGNWSATMTRDNEVSFFDNTPGMNNYGGTEAGVLWGRNGELYKYEWKWLRQWDRTNGTDELIRSVDHVVRIK